MSVKGKLSFLKIVILNEIVFEYSGFPISPSFLTSFLPGFGEYVSYVGCELVYITILYCVKFYNYLLLVFLFSIGFLLNGLVEELEGDLNIKETTITIVQTNIQESVSALPGVLKNHIYRKKQVTDLLREVPVDSDIVLAPEGFLPSFSGYVEEEQKEIIKSLKLFIYHNYLGSSESVISITNIERYGEKVASFSKSKGIPFVESEIEMGKVGLYKNNSIGILPLICSDSLNKIEIKKNIRNTDVILVSLNEISILNSPMRLFHELIDMSTAKVYGVPLIRSSNGGKSSFVNHRGELIEQMNVGEGVQSMKVLVGMGSFYKKNILYFCLAKYVLLLVVVLFLIIECTKKNLFILFTFLMLVLVDFKGFYKNSIQPMIESPPPLVINDLSLFMEYFGESPDKEFIFRQMGVSHELSKSALDVKAIKLNQNNDTLGVGYINTIYGYITIMDVRDEYVMAVFGDKALPVSKETLQNVMVGKLMWYEYKK